MFYTSARIVTSSMDCYSVTSLEASTEAASSSRLITIDCTATTCFGGLVVNISIITTYTIAALLVIERHSVQQAIVVAASTVTIEKIDDYYYSTEQCSTLFPLLN